MGRLPVLLHPQPFPAEHLLPVVRCICISISAVFRPSINLEKSGFRKAELVAVSHASLDELVSKA